MKKIIFLLSLSLTSIYASAQNASTQKIDKNLLIGKWDIYSFTNHGISVYRDSLEEDIKVMVKLRKSNKPNLSWTIIDSLKVVDEVTSMLENIFKSNIMFDAKGNTKAKLGLGTADGKMEEETGTYEWTADNKIIQKTNKPSSTSFVVLKLTADVLVIKFVEEEDNSETELSFTRAK